MKKAKLVKLFSLVSALVVSFLLSSSLYALENLHLGRLQINPYLKFKVEYNSNIYLQQNNEKDDFITYFTPGFNLYFPWEENFIEFDYHVDLLSFSAYSDENTQRQFISLNSDLKFGRNLTLNFEEKFEKTDEPATSELTERQDRTRNLAKVSLAWEGDKLGLEGGFTSIQDDYKNLDELDRYENIFSLTGFYRFLPKTQGLVEYKYGDITYDKETGSHANAEYNQLSLGIKGNITSKLTGLIKGGYQWRDYSRNKKDFDGGVVYSSLIHQLNPRTQTSLFVERGVNESTFSGNNYYEYNQVGLEFQKKLGYKQKLTLNLSYERDDFPVKVSGQERKDDLWSFKAGWDYSIRKWISLGVSYRYRNRDSSIYGYDYTDNIVAFSTNLTF